MLGAFGAALAKDFRLVARDRVGLVFLTIAPMVVITVAGLSLAQLYDVGPRGASPFMLALVDEDGGDVGRTLHDRLAAEAAVDLCVVPDRAAARSLVRAKRASVALVVPAGTSAALADGRPAALLVYTDPVRSIELANVRGLVQELRHGVERAAREKAAAAVADAQARAEDARRRLAADTDRLRAQLETVATRLAAARREAEQRRAAAVRGLDAARATAAGRVAEARERLAAMLAPLRAFLDTLEARQRAFAEWLATARARAGALADRLPPPPEAPVVPPALADLARADPATLAERLLPRGDQPTLPALPEPPALPTLPALVLPELPSLDGARLPGTLEIEETSVTGAPSRLNTFDQNVPGFSITFLLLGVLLGVSLGLLDEKDWGTLERLRTMPTPIGVALLAKLAVRATIGLTQMVLLFAVGRALFGVSLGSEPWGLLLPTAGIVLAGTAFGLVIAALAPTREAVLPLGSIAILTMAATGGCWWPIDLEPRWMRQAALAFPTTWAMDAYNDLMIRRLPARAALRATAVLLAYATLYLSVGFVLFRRRLQRTG